jgi:hypothetical protein
MLNAFARLQISLPSVQGIEMTLLKLFSPCLFGHGNMLRTRDEEGFLSLQCEDCGRTNRVMVRPAIKGPRFHAVPVKGAPLVTARIGVVKRSYPRSA